MAKILIAEDDHMLSSLLVHRLQVEGFETEATYEGDTTIAKIREWKPDLLLLDIMMPGKNGYDVLEAIKGDPGRESLFVIILSNLSAQEDIERARAYHVYNFLVKAHTSPEEVAKEVKRLLS